MLMVSQLTPLLNALPVQAQAGASSVLIQDFKSGDKSHNLTWQTVNDPVMGGQSTSSLTVDPSMGAAVWEGKVRIVPFLHAAGFCTCMGYGGSGIPDLSPYSDLVFDVSSLTPPTNLTNFQAQFESSVRTTERGGNFIADFTLVAGQKQIVVPFKKFVESYHGQRIAGKPSAKQLANIQSIGLGLDGTVGQFKVLISSISASNGAPPSPSPPSPPSVSIPLVKFTDGGNYKWRVINDPVMGGLSTSTFKDENDMGVFAGTVRIVPSLKAPGFCNAEAVAPFGKSMPDASSTIQGGIEMVMHNAGNMTAFKFAFGTRGEYDFGSYKADFTVANSGNSESTRVYIPYNHFSNRWSASTGEPTTKCSDDKRVCPTQQALKDIGSVGIWAEGTAGEFRLEIQEINAIIPS